MRKVLIAISIVSVIGSGAASAKGPGGSTEGRKASANNLRCGKTTKVHDMRLYAAQNGAEFCNDGKTVPLHGRVIVDAKKQYVALDGDKHNPGPASGYARIDRTGPHCSKGKDQDSERSRTRGDPSTCNGS